MELKPKRLMRKSYAAFLSALILIANSANAGDPSSVVGATADASPEAQVKILRILFDDVAASPQELRQRMAIACKKRAEEKCIKTSMSSCPQVTGQPPATTTHSLSQKSKADLLLRLCSTIKP